MKKSLLSVLLIGLLLFVASCSDSNYEGETNNQITSELKEKKEVSYSSETEKEEVEDPLADATVSQANAYRSAVSYLKHSSFSRQGLIEQLEFEKYSTDDAIWAVDKCEVDWKEQAVMSGESYLKHSAFSYDGLIEQLEFEGFSNEQATYAADSLFNKTEKTDVTEEMSEGVSDDSGRDSLTETMGQKNALSKAKSYLSFSSFSHSGLIEQLEFDGFTDEEAQYGADKCGADWNEQALSKAKSYLSFSAFSYSGLIEQLEFDGFSDEEAKYGVENCGADWNEQAVKKAQSYLSFSSFSKSGLIDQLEFDGFTKDQATYGVEQNGY